MKKSLKIFIILVVFLFELAWFAWPRLSLHGRLLDESYRHDERLTAMNNRGKNPSPETQAAFDREVALLDKHMSERAFAILTVVLIIDAAGIYFFWRYAPKKTTA
jgi:flagellar basal body-associated protein FliL